MSKRMSDDERLGLEARWLADYGAPIHDLEPIAGREAVAFTRMCAAEARLAPPLLQLLARTTEDLAGALELGEAQAAGAITQRFSGEFAALALLPGRGRSQSRMEAVIEVIESGAGSAPARLNGVLSRIVQGVGAFASAKSLAAGQTLLDELRATIVELETLLPKLDLDMFSPPHRGPARDVGLIVAAEGVAVWIAERKGDGTTSKSDVASALRYFGHDLPVTVDPGGDLLRAGDRILAKLSEG